MDFDVAIIGSGPGGYKAAILAALRGLKVATIEKADWGGCCLNRGCVPKKTWYYTAKQIDNNMKHFEERGIHGKLSADLDIAWQHQEKVVDKIKESYVDYMKRLGVQLYQGTARFEDSHTISIEQATETLSITSQNIIIATGSESFIPEQFTLEEGKIITSDMLYDMPPPKGDKVAIVGSGIVATEFSYILTLFGKQVTWVARSKPMTKLNFSEPAIARLKKALKAYKIDVHYGVATDYIEKNNGHVTLHLSNNAQVTADWVLLATGRKPFTKGLGLEKVDIKTDQQGFIQHNEYLQTNHAHIYAIGDVAHPQMTANQAIADAKVVIDNILTKNSKQYNPSWVPIAIYSAIELARIGLDEEIAEDKGYEPAVGFAAFEHSPCALGQDDTEGFVRVIADMDSGELLGGEVIGGDAAELIHLLSMAPDKETALRWLASGAYNHPARAEEFINATETLASKWGLKDFVF